MKLTRSRFTMRRMMAIIALSAVAVWAGLHQSEWRESFYQWRVNRPIRRQLDRKVTLRYPQGVTFRRLAGDIKTQTINAGSPGGLTIYVDVAGEGVDESGLVSTAVLKIDVQSIPLKEAIDSLLKPMKLTLYVKDGMATVSGEDELPDQYK